MDIGEIISDSISYPSQDWKKVIILGILTIISILIIPVFLVMGYFFRILKSSIAGFDELPDFDEWGEMFIDGLKIFVVQFVYLLIPLIVMFIGAWASIASMSVTEAGSLANPTLAFGLIGGTAIIGIILAILFELIGSIAVANMALNDSEFGAAFRFSEILEKISMIGWGQIHSMVHRDDHHQLHRWNHCQRTTGNSIHRYDNCPVSGLPLLNHVQCKISGPFIRISCGNGIKNPFSFFFFFLNTV